jgi:hypothetical protein
MRKLIYIMGCAHCGSTLLTRILARHSQIATVGELKMSSIPDYRNFQCGCGAELLECAFWKQVAAAFAEEGVALDFGDFGTHYGSNGSFASRVVGAQMRGPGFESLRRAAFTCWPPAARALARINQRNKIVIDKICEVLRKPVFLDDSKDPTRLMHLSRTGHYDIRAIYLVRDGRAIVASYKKRDPDMRANFHLWENKVSECERLRKVLPKMRLMEVRYEDFCQDSRRVLSEILAFSGLDDQSEHCLSPSTQEPQHIIGHNSRLLGDRPIELRNEWPALLTAQDLENFERRGRELNALYGYDLDESIPRQP